jgi:lipoprotein-anchoring transpeptidase ErfK/SrfK
VPSTEPSPVATVQISSPTDGATDVPAGTQIAYAATGEKTDVTLTDATGATVDGGPGYDPSTWVPKRALAYGEQYTAKVTSTGTDGKPTTGSVTFTTMAKPASLINVHSYLGDNLVYGFAVPIVLTLSHGVPVADRAAVQKRMTVTSTPSQPGAWSWISSTEVHYRPKTHWAAGTKFFANIQTGGMPMGDGYYGQNDLTVSSSITKDPLTIITDDKTHMLTVYEHGKVIKRMPASLGKKSTPSSSGELVIMSRKPSEEFDSSLGTGGVPVNAPGGYKELVYFTMRLTWDGQYIHAAPWSVKSQGHTDVSHGCTNVSTANAKWIYENSLVGTPVSVRHTTRKVVAGDGWTDWNVSWATFIKGSALPVKP